MTAGEAEPDVRVIPLPCIQWPEARGAKRQLISHPSAPTKVAQWVMALEAVLTENGVRRVSIEPQEKDAITMAAATLIKHMKLEFPEIFDGTHIAGVPYDDRTGYLADSLIERAEEIRRGDGYEA